jgi:prephenate dehydrogenase
VRLAKSDPELWTDILSSNSEAILSSLARFEGNLARFKRALQISDVQKRSHAILQLLVRVKQNTATFPDET